MASPKRVAYSTSVWTRASIEKRGSFYSFDGTRLGQGRENVKDFLRENIEIANQIEARVRQGVGLHVKSEASDPEDQSDLEVAED